MKNQDAYDIIGDIHGQHDKLAALLVRLGYVSDRADGVGAWSHPAKRRVVFLGDYIDRGPKVREVLQTVRAMVEGGDALAVMGNHEYNAICYHTPDGRGGWLRERHRERDSGLHATLAQFAGRAQEWTEWLEWMSRLPLYLDLGKFRAVHACWDAKRIGRLQGCTLADADFLALSATRGTPEHRAVENVLKGPELAMPEGCVYYDKEGTPRRRVRVRWWQVPAAGPVSSLALPEPFQVPGDAVPHELKRVPSYGPGEPPVFCGHYWLSPERPKGPLSPNVACLDYSAAFANNPLVGYRWDGEPELAAHKFISATF